MKIEDQLTKQERLRLECFNQAVNSSFTFKAEGRPSLEDIFKHALEIEDFLKSANSN